MKALLKMGLACAAMATLALSANAAGTKNNGPNDYTRTVARPYAQVLAAVKEAALAQGFKVTNVRDMADSLRKFGFHNGPLANVEVCRPEIAVSLLDAEPRLGSLMPCRITVFQQGQETTVTTILPSHLLAMLPEKSQVKKAAARVDRELKAIIDTATR